MLLLAPYIFCSIVFTVVDAKEAGEGNGLKAHNGGCKAVVGGVAYKNVHFDKSWVAYTVKGDPEVPPTDILNSDGKLRGDWDSNSFVVHKDIADRVFVVNKQNAKTCNRFHSVKPGDLVLNGYTSVMSVSTDKAKANEYAGGPSKKGTIWEVVTGNTGGKEIDPLSVIPPSHSDKVDWFVVCGLWFVVVICRSCYRFSHSSLGNADRARHRNASARSTALPACILSGLQGPSRQQGCWHLQAHFS